MARKVNTGLVFLKEEQITAHIKNLETREGQFIVEKPRLATDAEQKDNGVLGKVLSEGYKAYIYSWRFATKKEWNAAVQRNNPNAAFKLI